MLSYPCNTNGVDVVQGCAQTRLNFASDVVTGVTDWLRSGLELVVSSNFLYEMVLSINRTELKKVKLKTTLPYMGLD